MFAYVADILWHNLIIIYLFFIEIYLLALLILKILCVRLKTTTVTMNILIKFCLSDSSFLSNLLTFLTLFREWRERVVDLKEMIGSRIQELRNKKGITQDQLSEKAGISSKYLSSIERGKENPTLNTILKLARSLEARPDEIFVHLEIEDPAKRKSMILEILDDADEDQLKLAYKVLSVMIS